MKRVVALCMLFLIIIPILVVLVPRVESNTIIEDAIDCMTDSSTVWVCSASGISIEQDRSLSNIEQKAAQDPVPRGEVYIDMSHTNTADNQYDFDRWVDLYVDVDASPGPRTVDVATYLETPNNDIIDSGNYYGWVVQGTTDDYKWFSMYNGFSYMQYAGAQWHVRIYVMDSSTHLILDQKLVFFYVGPIPLDHFTCRDPYNPYATRTTTFYDTETAWDYTAWDTHNLWITYEVKWDFNGPGTSHLIAGPSDLPPGYSGWWVAGGITGGAAGSWYVDVLLNDVFRARDGFDILPPVLPQLDVTLVNPPDGSTVGSPIELRARVTSSGASVQNALVRFYVDSNSAGTSYSDSSGYASISYSPSIGTHNWYATGEKSGYTSGTSPLWSFSYGGPPDFLILADPNTVSIQVGSSGTTTVHVDSVNDFQASVSLGITGLPSGVTFSYSPPSVTPPANGRASSVLTLTVSSSATPGTYYPKVTGSSTSPSLYHEHQIVLALSVPQRTVTLKTKTTDGQSNINGNSGNTIILDSSPYNVPSTFSKPEGTYVVQATLLGSYSFHHWECAGGLTISESEKYSNPADVTISGDGEICVVFYYDIKLVFSTGETYFPVEGLSFDGNNDITDNYENYDSSTYQFPDLDDDGVRDDAPSYLYKSFDGTYTVFEYWIYSAYDNKKLGGVIPFWNHEHDFESVYLRIDSNHNIVAVSTSQHNWVNNYWSAIPRTIYVGVEQGGHGMLLLAGFSTIKPDNTDINPGLDGTFNANSKVACLYPSKTYYGSPLGDGFGSSTTTTTAFWEWGPIPALGTAHLDASIIYPLISLEYLSIGGNILDSSLHSILLKSSHPIRIFCVLGATPMYLAFHIKAPWVRTDFDDPALRWVTIGYSGFIAKKCAFFIANWASLGIKGLLFKVTLGIVKFTLNTIPNILGIINDPTELSIIDESGNILGYDNGELVTEIPGGLILTKESTYEIYLVFNNSTDLTHSLKCFAPGPYNLTIMASWFNETMPTQWLNSTDIPLDFGSEHVYTIDWQCLLEGQDAFEVGVDENGDGVFEHEFVSDSNITGEEFEQTIAHDISAEVVLICRYTVGKGRLIFANVTVQNQGIYPESFDLVLFADKNTTILGDEIIIGTSTVNSLENGAFERISFEWDTINAAYGNYTISAYAYPVAGEIDTEDNTISVNIEVCITLPGDLDSDFDVDIFDLVQLAAFYGTSNPPTWPIPPADIDGNGKVDIFDLVLAAGHYGESARATGHPLAS